LSDGELSKLLVFERQTCPTAHRARWHNKIINAYGGHFLLSYVTSISVARLLHLYVVITTIILTIIVNNNNNNNNT